MQEEILFKDISYLQIWRPFSWTELDTWCNFCRGHYEETICEIILNLDQWFSRKCHLKIFLAPVWQSRHVCAILIEGI